MDTEVHSVLPSEEKLVFPKPEKNVDENFVDVKSIERIASLGPINPDPNGDIGDFSIDLKSPLTLVNYSLPKKELILCAESHLTSTPVTPVDGVFDPFTPGPEELLHAPHCIKLRKELQINVVRRLNFDLLVDRAHEESCEADIEASKSDEELLVEIVYENLLEAIVSKQREGFVEDGCKTPDSAKRLSGIAETCPGAPMKCSRKSINLDKSLCRKLDFSDLE